MKKFIIALLVGFIVTIGLTIYSDALQADVAQNVLRLHVIANSDSEEDQALKLAVRDRLLSESGTLFENCETSAESRAVFYREQARLLEAAGDEIQKNGFSYPVDISLEKTYFPTRYYEGIALPAGEYDAVRVKIGKAEGRNWWCVMFPPLCFVDGSIDAESASSLTAVLGEDAAVLTPDSDAAVHVRFKVVDFFQNATHVIKEAFYRG